MCIRFDFWPLDAFEVTLTVPIIASSTGMPTSLISSFPVASSVLTPPPSLPRPSFAGMSLVPFLVPARSPPTPNPEKSADGDRGLKDGEDGEDDAAVGSGNVLDGCPEEAGGDGDDASGDGDGGA